MKTIEEIKNEVAVANDYKGWLWMPTNLRLAFTDKVAETYAEQCCGEPEWIAINSENDLPKDKNVFYFYAEGGKYYNTTPCNLMFLMSTYNFLKGSDKPVSHYKIIQKPHTRNVVTKAFVKCMEKDCSKEAVKDYNGHNHMVCQNCYECLNREFDEDYK